MRTLENLLEEFKAMEPGVIIIDESEIENRKISVFAHNKEYPHDNRMVRIDIYDTPFSQNFGVRFFPLNEDLFESYEYIISNRLAGWDYLNIITKYMREEHMEPQEDFFKFILSSLENHDGFSVESGIIRYAGNSLPIFGITDPKEIYKRISKEMYWNRREIHYILEHLSMLGFKKIKVRNGGTTFKLKGIECSASSYNSRWGIEFGSHFKIWVDDKEEAISVLRRISNMRNADNPKILKILTSLYFTSESDIDELNKIRMYYRSVVYEDLKIRIDERSFKAKVDSFMRILRIIKTISNATGKKLQVRAMRFNGKPIIPMNLLSNQNKSGKIKGKR